MVTYESMASPAALTIPCLAQPEDVSSLRRKVTAHLENWGVPHVAGSAQLCVSELVTNVIVHVGTGTPVTLHLRMNGSRVRIEVTDPVCRALPVLLSATGDEESGRGLALLDAVAVQWGVILSGDSKTTWCELAAEHSLAGRGDHARDGRAEAVLAVYGAGEAGGGAGTRLTSVRSQEAAVGLIADVLRRLSDEGRDPDEVLDQAQMHFESLVSR